MKFINKFIDFSFINIAQKHHNKSFFTHNGLLYGQDCSLMGNYWYFKRFFDEK